MKSIKEVLVTVLKQKEIKALGDIAILQKEWSSLLGPLVAKNAEPVALRGKQLVVWVKNSSWANELSMMKKEIMKKIETTYPELSIHQIRFVLKRDF